MKSEEKWATKPLGKRRRYLEIVLGVVMDELIRRERDGDLPAFVKELAKAMTESAEPNVIDLGRRLLKVEGLKEAE